MNKAFAAIISFYQRFVSPYKGFSCAAAVYYNSFSCSQAVKQIILERGVIRGRLEIRDQFRRCSVAAGALRVEKKKPKRKRPLGGAECALTESVCWSCSMWP